MLTIKFDGHDVQTALAQTLAALQDPRPMLEKIGEELAESTMRRFPQGRGPDGVPWAKKSAVTVANHPRGGTKPLIGESKTLSTTISHKVPGNTVVVGSNAVQAAVMQFGAPAGSLWRGKDRRGRNAMAPWGDIPARPFLGVSAEDEQTVLDVVADYLQM